MTLLDRLYQTHLFAEKNGLENMKRLCGYFNHPEQQLRSIHIAGSNGKGSVATKTAAGLQAAGYRVGLFTSPHIRRFHERIKINGIEIAESALDGYLEQILALIEEKAIPATFFEVTTLCGFLYFADQQVDWAVLETGLGGRFDATNVVIPQVCAITSISLEHTEILGSTIDAIAREKAGIIKEGVPVVIGPNVPEQVIREATENYRCVSVTGDTFTAENNGVARAIMELLDLKPSEIEVGLSATPPCRMEITHGAVTIIRDGAHNPDALKQLLHALDAEHGWKRFHLVCGFGNRKDVSGSLQILKPVCETITLLEPTQERLASVSTLRAALPEGMPFLGTSPAKALSRARSTGLPVLFTGSFYIFKDDVNKI